MKMIRVLLVDDEPSVRQGLRMRLGLEPDIDVVGEAGDGRDAIVAAGSLDPDIVVMDYEMPGMTGCEAARALVAAGYRCGIVMLTIHDGQRVQQEAALAGASAFVAKHEPTESLLAAVRSSAPGDQPEPSFP